MKAQEWRQALGECVRDFFRTPEMEHFYSIKMTRERARIYLLQLAQLRGFAGVKAHKWLKNQPANLKGLHYRAVTEVA